MGREWAESFNFQALSYLIPWEVLPALLREELQEKVGLVPVPIALLPAIRGQKGAVSIALPLSASTCRRMAKKCAEKKMDKRQLSASECEYESTDEFLKTVFNIRYATSPHMTALYLLSTVALCKAMVNTLPHKNTCNKLVTFHCLDLLERIPGFCQASLLLLAQFWQDSDEDIVVTARDLFMTCTKFLPGVQRQSYADVWIQRLRDTTTESKVTAAVVLGLLAVDHPECLLPKRKIKTTSMSSASSSANVLEKQPQFGGISRVQSTVSYGAGVRGGGSGGGSATVGSEGTLMLHTDDKGEAPIARLICDQLVPLIFQDTSSLQTASLEILGKGYASLWRTHFDKRQRVILKCFRLSVQSDSPSVSTVADSALNRIGRTNAADVADVLARGILKKKFDNSECAAALNLLSTLMETNYLAVISRVTKIAESIVTCLDPNDLDLRDKCTKSGTGGLHELVRRYPMVAFHQGSQLLAVGDGSNLLSVYDLKQGVKIHELHCKGASSGVASNSRKSTLSPPPLSSSVADARLTSAAMQGKVISGITATAFNDQGRIVAAYSFEDGQIYFWQLYSPLSFFGIGRPQLLCSFGVSKMSWPSLERIRLQWTSARSLTLVRGGPRETLTYTI